MCAYRIFADETRLQLRLALYKNGNRKNCSHHFSEILMDVLLIRARILESGGTLPEPFGYLPETVFATTDVF